MCVRADERHEAIPIQIRGEFVEDIKTVAETRITGCIVAAEITRRIVHHRCGDDCVVAGFSLVEDLPTEVGDVAVHLCAFRPQRDAAVDIGRVRVITVRAAKTFLGPSSSSKSMASKCVTNWPDFS